MLIFTCNSCPVAVGYEDRILALTKKYTDKSTAFVAVNVNTIEEDRLDKMQERAQDKGFAFPYLYDESQRIAKDYGAMYTPEFFVLDQHRRIAYMGAMDDVSPPLPRLGIISTMRCRRCSRAANRRSPRLGPAGVPFAMRSQNGERSCLAAAAPTV